MRARVTPCVVLVSLLAVSPYCGQGQEWQFGFDLNGNLLTQVTENLTPPQILAQPKQQIVGPGELASFFVVSADTRDLAYQWRFNGTNLDGPTADTLLLTNVSAANEGQYSVQLINGSGSVTSAPAMLWYDGNANGLPDSWELTRFGNLNQTAAGDLDGDGVSNLDEFLDGTDPTNSVSVRYRLRVLNDGGSVAVLPSKASYTNGEVVTLTATAFPPAIFRGWAGDVSTTNNPLTLTMNGNKTVVALQGSAYNLTWTNVFGGDWNAATNWDPNTVPMKHDRVFISGIVNVVINGTNECAELTLGGGGGQPIISGNGVLTVYGKAAWVSGSMIGGGRTVIAPGASLILSNASSVTLSRTLENAGTTVCAGTGGLYGGAAPGVVTNRAGALFEVRNDASFTIGLAACRFDNAGTFRKTASAGTNLFDGGYAFNNYGTVDLQNGALLCYAAFLNNGTVSFASGTISRLLGGGSGNGTFLTPGTAAVEFSSSYMLNPGAQLNGVGLYKVSGGSLIANADISVQNLDLAAGLDGTGALTVSNVLNWTGGFMSGDGRTLIAPGATLNISNAGNVTLSRTLENAGTSLCLGSGGISGTIGASVITNRPGALFEVRNNASFTIGLSACRFDNAGTFRKTISTGTNTFAGGYAFNNYGAVELQSGTLQCIAGLLNNGTMTLWPGTTNRLTGGGSGNGTFTVPSTALVQFGSSYVLNPGAQLNGVGMYRVSSGSLVANADVSVQNLDLAAGLDGAGIVTVASVLNWTNGFMSGSGRTVISPGATLNLTSPSDVSLTRTLENAGTTLCTGAGGFYGSSGTGVITNRPAALFEMRNNASFTHGLGSCRFDNAGTFRKSLSLGTNTFDGAFAFNNYGTVDLRSGILAANGGYNSGIGALLNCAIGGTVPGAGYAQLRAGGAVTLNGALSVVLTNGFLPTTNDSFAIVTAGARSGTFAAFQYPSNQMTMSLSNTATSVIVRVDAVTTPPLASPPLLLPPVVSGSNLVLTWTTVSNVAYRLEFNPDLTSSNWNAVPGDVVGAGNTVTRADALTSTNRFYRVRIVP